MGDKPLAEELRELRDKLSACYGDASLPPVQFTGREVLMLFAACDALGSALAKQAMDQMLDTLRNTR